MESFNQVIVVGFPKCGTSALMRTLEADSAFCVLRSADGKLELPWPLIKTITMPDSSDLIVAHKYVSYIYKPVALKELGENPKSLFVCMVRNPLRALISWHRMHQVGALSGKNKNHFAFKNREFFGKCSIDEYYETFARSRLNYDLHFARMTSFVPANQIMVIAQESLARNTIGCGQFLREYVRARGTPLAPPRKAGDQSSYVGYADKIAIDISPVIVEQLQLVDVRLRRAISDSRVIALL